MARLACAHQNQPYVTPIYFVYHEPHLYGFTTPGQKVEWMRYNPLVCLELDDVADVHQWTSVIIFGHYEELGDAPEWKDQRLRAFEILQEHAGWWQPACASSSLRVPGQSPTPVFYRIHIDRITGRQAVPEMAQRRQPNPTGYRPKRSRWWQTLVHAFSRPARAGNASR